MKAIIWSFIYGWIYGWIAIAILFKFDDKNDDE